MHWIPTVRINRRTQQTDTTDGRNKQIKSLWARFRSVQNAAVHNVLKNST